MVFYLHDELFFLPEGREAKDCADRTHEQEKAVRQNALPDEWATVLRREGELVARLIKGWIWDICASAEHYIASYRGEELSNSF